jgi:hypothetical protein
LVLAKYVDQLEKQGKIRVMTPDDLGWKARAGDKSAIAFPSYISS